MATAWTLTAAVEPACREFVVAARASALRPMLQWAEEEVIMPDGGPREGLRFRAGYPQAFSRLWFNEIDSGRWRRHAITGPGQDGKTVIGFTIPICYHLFEVGERVGIGVPTLDMVKDKWHDDIRPIVEQTRYREYLPRKGPASSGGTPLRIQFGNGTVARFFTFGGGDKTAAAWATRVMVITEVDGGCDLREGSVETDRIGQLEGRTNAWDDLARIYLECTVSVKSGRIWQEVQNGTASRIVLQCPKCKGYVTPEREHLKGWQDAENIVQARAAGHVICPNCAKPWTEKQRHAANAKCRLVHEGQTITKRGKIRGKPKPVETFGLRWNCVNSGLKSMGGIAAEEWTKIHSLDEDNKERALRQFKWAIPVEPEGIRGNRVTFESLRGQIGNLGRGICPPDTDFLTLGSDTGMYLNHWVVVAWLKSGRGHIVDYGLTEVPTDQFGIERAMILAIRELEDSRIATPYPKHDGGTADVLQAWIDARGKTRTTPWERQVYQACAAGNKRLGVSDRWEDFILRPAWGFGAGQIDHKPYQTPNRKTSICRFIADDGSYDFSWRKGKQALVAQIDTNRWKSWAWERFATPPGDPGSLVLFRAPEKEHIKFRKHVTAEEPLEEFIPGKGNRVVWKQLRKQNHWFDALYLACAAAHWRGFRIVLEDGSTQATEVVPGLAARAREQRQGKRASGSSGGWFSKQKRAG